jgi:hypothetical protein
VPMPTFASAVREVPLASMSRASRSTVQGGTWLPGFGNRAERDQSLTC